MFVYSCARPPELCIWNLHQLYVLNLSHLLSEGLLVEEDCRLPSLPTTPRLSDLHLKTYER